VSTLTPLSSPVAELLIARFGWDDLNLDWRRPQPTELEAPTTGLMDDPTTIRRDVAQGVDLVVELPIGKGSDFGEQGFSIRRILRSGNEDGVGSPFNRRAPQTREGVSLKVGALLVREWKGQLERVMILEEGFAWNGQTFRSLSQVAKAMTGTDWNGHRFFGLRQGKTSAADVGTDRRNSRNRTAVCSANGASAGDASP
jgi:hypothetical protein